MVDQFELYVQITKENTNGYPLLKIVKKKGK